MNNFEHNGYKIYESSGGFRLGNGMFAIQSYIATQDGFGYGFAFCVSTLGAVINGFNVDDTVLIKKARQTVVAYLDTPDELIDHEEYTFQFNLDDESF